MHTNHILNVFVSSIEWYNHSMSKKIAKVVLNSVSHDARVIKEAQSLSEAGFDVSIIGIEDAKNDVPFEKFNEKVDIYRAAWKSYAVLPGKTVYIISFLAALILGYGGYILFNNASSTRAVFDTVASELTQFPIFKFALAVVALVAVSVIIKNVIEGYIQKIGSYGKLKAHEAENSLRYNLTNVSKINTTNQSNLFIKFIPRFLAQGLGKIFSPQQNRTWRVVYAREQAITEILENIKPDIVHAHDISALPVCHNYKKKYGSKLVFDAHEIYDRLAQADDDTSNLNKFMLRKYSNSVDMFVTINSSISKYYSIMYPDFPSAIVVKNAAHNDTEVHYDGRLHEACGISKSKKIILYQGGFAQKRGLEALLLSAKYLDESWQLVFMGWGNFEEDLNKAHLLQNNNDLKSLSNVSFVGKARQDELAYWSSGATIGVIPYENIGLNHWYCTPNKLWEYPNANVPILVSPFPEMQKVLEKWKIGWELPDPLDPKSIAVIINNLDESEIIEAKENCKNYMKSDNWNLYAKKLIDGYKKLNQNG